MNKINSSKINIVSLLVFSALAMTSCGKSKDLKTAPAKPGSNSSTTASGNTTPPASTTPPAPTASPAPPTETPTPQPVPVEPTKPNTNNPPNELLPAEDQTQNNTTNNNADLLPLPSNSQSGDTTNTTSVIRPPLVNSTLQTEKAYQIDFSNQVAIKTGGQVKSGNENLFYTSAGNDGLMEEFKNYSAKVSSEQQSLNSQLAKSVFSAKLLKNNLSGKIYVQIQLNESGKLQVYQFNKTPDSASTDKLNLKLDVPNSSGKQAFQGGFLKCLDKDGLCEVAYAKIKIANAYTRIIFRNSFSDLHFLFQENVSNNPRFSNFLDYVLNAANAYDTTKRFNKLQLSSFEVVNGKAHMKAQLTAEDQQEINMSIPLIVGSKFSEVNHSIQNVLPAQSSVTSTLSEKINMIRLLQNNGKGQFKLEFQFKGNDSTTSSIWMVGSRNQKATISLDDIRTFEKQ